MDSGVAFFLRGAARSRLPQRGPPEGSRLGSTIPHFPGLSSVALSQAMVGDGTDATMFVVTEETPSVDISGLHTELDRLKAQLCRCQHQGTCIACQGFEVIRQQVQVVV